MTHGFFKAQMQRLTGLRFTPADLTTHWEALKDLPDAVLTGAVTRAQKTRVDFPTPVELRVDADAIAHHVQSQDGQEKDRTTALAEPLTFTIPQTGQAVSVTREYQYGCEACSDTGWVTMWCGEDRPHRKPWVALGNCGHAGVHGHHEYARRCSCWECNPVLVHKREAQRKYAEARK